MTQGIETESGVDFGRIERDHVRSRLYPDFDWVAFDAFSPYNRLRVPLAEARVAFVTTAGAHLPDQAPFDRQEKAGDPSYRAFPSGTPLEDLVLTHSGYDTRQATADKNVVLPLDHLRAAEADGRIGRLAPTVYSCMGYVADVVPFMEETAPTIASRLAADAVDLVLLAPT
jgi:D-proline reductase (dithiol) PrdB